MTSHFHNQLNMLGNLNIKKLQNTQKMLICKPPDEHDIFKSDGIGGREQFPNSPPPLVDPLPPLVPPDD